MTYETPGTKIKRREIQRKIEKLIASHKRLQQKYHHTESRMTIYQQKLREFEQSKIDMEVQINALRHRKKELETDPYA